MDGLSQEGYEDDAERVPTCDDSIINRCRMHGNIDATGVYLDLLRRPRAEQEPTNNGVQSCSVADGSTTNSSRVSISQTIRNQEASENNESRETHEIETDSILEPFTLLTDEETDYGTENQTGPPPSYTSLPPPLPAIILPPITHPIPPPTYEQTFGLRYLDRDQPVLVFNSENMWGYRPQLAYCMSCNAMVLTNVNAQYCHATHIVAIISFLLCCWPCCVLPYFIPALKEVHHHCPACNNHLGAYYPFSRTA